MNLFHTIVGDSMRAPISFIERDGTRCLTREALADSAMAMAVHLRSKGVSQGDTVALLSTTSPFMVAAMMGAWALGASTVILPHPLGRYDEAWWGNRWSQMLLEAKVQAVCLGRYFVAKFRQAIPAELINILTLTVEDESLAVGAYQYDKQHELLHKQFTSGTTGLPKVIEVTHSQIQCNAMDIHNRLRVSTQDVHLSWLPLYHDMGFIFGFCAPLLWDIPLVLIETQLFNRNPSIWLQSISKHTASISTAPSSTFHNLGMHLPQRRFRDLSLSSWRVAGVGSEPIYNRPLDVFANKMKHIGFDSNAYTPGYGLAEATLAATIMSPGDTIQLSRSLGNGDLLVGCGQPLENVCLAIGTPSCKPFEEDGGINRTDEGVILLKGKTIISASTRELEWLDTGDLGFVANGQLFITGRKKDLIIVGGQNYQPVWLEDIASVVLRELLQQARSRSAAFQVSDGSIFLIYETRKPSQSVNQSLASAVQNTIGISAAVHSVPPGSIPYTTSGKLARQQCSRLFDELGLG